ncbi:serine hydrolase domain-containing protein [Aliidiomarina indica]|uniref:serine hydrolase domain-containing protein n=1 Tax=Aliidiomarina indica TaxID=2749147 RepID=UPI0018906AC2|nr:serine hydrolase domain-containing protein [Aliidiomarina indica]
MSTFFKWIVATAAICAGVFNISAHASESKVGVELHAEMEKSIENEGLAGVVWATVTPDGIATGAAGLADVRRQEPLSPEGRVQTGSIVKTLIATGILRLVTEGRLTLDSPVAPLLPDVKFENNWASSHPVLVRHLLDHTSGLDDARLWQVFSLNAEPDAPLRTSIQREPLRIRSRPGSRLSYSNLGYTLLGMVIEQVTGQRYEHYLDSQLLYPLGMHRSTFQFVSQEGPHEDTSLAMGHFEGGATQPSVPLYLRPAGQFTSTAADMALLARYLMSNGEIDGKPFIAPDLLRVMGRPTTTEAALAGLVDAGYGLGLNSRDRHGVVGNCHVGTTVGFRANFCLFPKEQKAFFIAINADAETADYDRFDALLIQELGIDAATPAPIATPPDGISDWQGVYILAPSRTESFAYLDQALNFATVRWDGRQLHLNPFQGAARPLLPTGDRLFRAEERTRASHVLIVSDQGKRVISDGFRSYEQASLWRMVPLWASLAAGLAGLVWLLVSGIVRVLRRRLQPSSALFVPFLAAVALLLPIPLFFGQSFLQLGDLTTASALLALMTGILPLAMIFGLWRSFRWGATDRGMLWDKLAMLGVLQWCVVLAFWGLMPVRLWS